MKALKRVQVKELGSVSEWVFPLEKALETALESMGLEKESDLVLHLASPKVQELEKELAQALGLAKAQVSELVSESELEKVSESGWVQELVLAEEQVEVLEPLTEKE